MTTPSSTLTTPSSTLKASTSMPSTTPTLSLRQPEFTEVEPWRAPLEVSVNYYSAFDPIAWESCRERFSGPMKKPGFKGFYFAHDLGKGDTIANFIFKTEEILDLPERTTYAKTSCDQILKINMTDFWMCSYVRRSLFTILPRLGNLYNLEKDNYEKTLFEPSRSPTHGYSTTVPAVKRFLYGFTVYDAPDPEYEGTGSLETSGWCKLFYRSDSWKKLVKEDKKLSPIGIGKLWG